MFVKLCQFFGTLLNIWENLTKDGDNVRVRPHLLGSGEKALEPDLWVPLGFFPPFRLSSPLYLELMSQFFSATKSLDKSLVPGERDVWKACIPKGKTRNRQISINVFFESYGISICTSQVLQNSLIKQTFIEGLLGARHKSHLLTRTKHVNQGL